MSKTKIEWVKNTDGTKGMTWNPVTGCTKVSPGCAHCYAERMARRLAGRCGYPEAPHHFDVTLRPDRLEQPLRRKKPTTYFVCSMSDLFHEDVPDDFILRVWRTMDDCPQHTFLVLTKRPSRMLSFVGRRLWRKRWGDWRKRWGELTTCKVDSRVCGITLPNVWPGVSIENQTAANKRIPLLLQTPAAVHFVSLEPLLGPVNLYPRRWLNPYPERFTNGFDAHTAQPRYRDVERPKLNWIVVGGESGPGARPMDPQWARDIRDQCQAAGVPFFFKQWGAWIPVDQWEATCREKITTANSGHVHHWPDGRDSLRIGKKAAGRLLDGRTWDEMPRG